MTLDEGTLRRVIEILETLQIPYMVTGSLASSHHGHPRTSEDADVVIEPTEASLETSTRGGLAMRCGDSASST